jgi:hypothetical protein
MVTQHAVEMRPSANDGALRRKLKLSVRSPDNLHPNVSNACVSSNNLHAVLTWLRCHLPAYHVYPISTRSTCRNDVVISRASDDRVARQLPTAHGSM